MPKRQEEIETLRKRLDRFRHNILSINALRSAHGPEDLLRGAAQALRQCDFVGEVKTYLLENTGLVCTGKASAPERESLESLTHPARRALVEEIITDYREDGSVDIARAVGTRGGLRGVLRVTLRCRDEDSELLTYNLLDEVSERLRLLQHLCKEELTPCTEPREPADSGLENPIAILVHELSNPLAAMLAHLELLQMGRGSDSVVAGHVAVLIPQVERLALILDRARRYAKAADARLKLVNVGETLSAVVELLRYHYQAHGVTLDLKLPAKSLPSVPGNSARLQQAWLNYLNNAFNAVRRQRKGPRGISLKVRHDKKLCAIVVEIRDTGVGMPEETARSLASLATGGSTATPHAGIGMTESARVIAEHQGSVEITSKLLKGTTVSVVLPEAPGT